MLKINFWRVSYIVTSVWAIKIRICGALKENDKCKSVSEVLSSNRVLYHLPLMLCLKRRFRWVSIIPQLQLRLRCTDVRSLYRYWIGHKLKYFFLCNMTTEALWKLWKLVNQRHNTKRLAFTTSWGYRASKPCNQANYKLLSKTLKLISMSSQSFPHICWYIAGILYRPSDKYR